MYVVIGVAINGKRDILGIWAGESAKLWLQSHTTSGPRAADTLGIDVLAQTRPPTDRRQG